MIAALIASLVIGATGGGYAGIEHCTFTYAPTADEWFNHHSLGVGYKTCKLDKPPLRRGLVPAHKS